MKPSAFMINKYFKEISSYAHKSHFLIDVVYIYLVHVRRRIIIHTRCKSLKICIGNIAIH